MRRKQGGASLVDAQRLSREVGLLIDVSTVCAFSPKGPKKAFTHVAAQPCSLPQKAYIF